MKFVLAFVLVCLAAIGAQGRYFEDYMYVEPVSIYQLRPSYDHGYGYHGFNRVNNQQYQRQQIRYNHNDGIEFRGSYGYRTPEGQRVNVKYVADEFGYRPNVNIS